MNETIPVILDIISTKEFFIGFLIGAGVTIFVFSRVIKSLYESRIKELKDDIQNLKDERDALKKELLKQQNLNMIGDIFGGK